MDAIRRKKERKRMKWRQDTTCCDRPPLSKEVPLEEAGFSETEMAILEVSRFYWQTFAEPSSQSWLFALQSAEERFGGAHGGELGLEILACVQSMRMSRKSCFRFNSSRCKDCAAFVSEHERQFMNVFISLRDGNRGAALTHAMILCEGNSTDAFIDRMRHLNRGVKQLNSSKTVASHLH